MLSEYPDVHFATSPFAENGSSSSFDLYEDEESPVSDSVYAQFDREGALNSIVVTYSNLDSVSEQDEEYFAGLLNGYLQAEGITASYTVESNYRERQDILMANLSVTFTDEGCCLVGKLCCRQATLLVLMKALLEGIKPSGALLCMRILCFIRPSERECLLIHLQKLCRDGRLQRCQPPFLRDLGEIAGKPPHQDDVEPPSGTPPRGRG